MSTQGADYAWTHPSPVGLAAAGIRFACRYLSYDTAKNLTLAEATALSGVGIACVANWEYGAKDALLGRSRGASDAKTALTQATAAGMPANRPIYFSVDWDVAPTEEASVMAYLDGAASVLGTSRVGIYGGFYPVKTALDGGHASWAWQTVGWSGGQRDGRVNIYQTGGTTTVSGVEIDLDEALTTDYGQWMPDTAVSTGGTVTLQLSKEDVSAIVNGIPGQPGLLDTLIPRQGSGATGNASLRGILGWFDHDVAAIIDAVNKLSEPPAVDVGALAAALAPLIAAGASADAVATAVLKHLSADTATG